MIKQVREVKAEDLRLKKLMRDRGGNGFEWSVQDDTDYWLSWLVIERKPDFEELEAAPYGIFLSRLTSIHPRS
jgi:hypothetical protein